MPLQRAQFVCFIAGKGRVSASALKLAKLARARVIAASASNDKLERLCALVADALTDRHGVDHVVEAGRPDTLDNPC